MFFAPFQNLKTERLILRRMSSDDAEGFFRFAGSEKVTRYMLWKPHKDLSGSVASIEKTLKRYEAGKCYRWAVVRKEDGRIMGIIDLLNFDEINETCSFAYMLGEEFWGKGYGTEALKAVLDFAFTQMKVLAVEADHFAENGASGAVMRKAGMVYVQTDERKYEKNGQCFDAQVYRITAEEWNNP